MFLFLASVLVAQRAGAEVLCSGSFGNIWPSARFSAGPFPVSQQSRWHQPTVLRCADDSTASWCDVVPVSAELAFGGCLVTMSNASHQSVVSVAQESGRASRFSSFLTINAEQFNETCALAQWLSPTQLLIEDSQCIPRGNTHWRSAQFAAFLGPPARLQRADESPDEFCFKVSQFRDISNFDTVSGALRYCSDWVAPDASHLVVENNCTSNTACLAVDRGAGEHLSALHSCASDLRRAQIDASSQPPESCCCRFEFFVDNAMPTLQLPSFVGQTAATEAAPAAAEATGGSQDAMSRERVVLSGVAAIGSKALHIPHRTLVSRDDQPGWSLAMWIWVASGFNESTPTGGAPFSHRALLFKGFGGTDQHRTPSVWLSGESNRLLLRVSGVEPGPAPRYDAGGESAMEMPIRRWVHVVFSFRNVSHPATFLYDVWLDGELATRATFYEPLVVTWNAGGLAMGRTDSFDGVPALIADLRVLEAPLQGPGDAGALMSAYAGVFAPVGTASSDAAWPLNGSVGALYYGVVQATSLLEDFPPFWASGAAPSVHRGATRKLVGGSCASLSAYSPSDAAPSEVARVLCQWFGALPSSGVIDAVSSAVGAGLWDGSLGGFRHAGSSAPLFSKALADCSLPASSLAAYVPGSFDNWPRSDPAPASAADPLRGDIFAVERALLARLQVGLARLPGTHHGPGAGSDDLGQALAEAADWLMHPGRDNCPNELEGAAAQLLAMRSDVEPDAGAGPAASGQSWWSHTAISVMAAGAGTLRGTWRGCKRFLAVLLSTAVRLLEGANTAVVCPALERGGPMFLAAAVCRSRGGNISSINSGAMVPHFDVAAPSTTSSDAPELLLASSLGRSLPPASALALIAGLVYGRGDALFSAAAIIIIGPNGAGSRSHSRTAGKHARDDAFALGLLHVSALLGEPQAWAALGSHYATGAPAGLAGVPAYARGLDPMLVPATTAAAVGGGDAAGGVEAGGETGMPRSAPLAAAYLAWAADVAEAHYTSTGQQPLHEVDALGLDGGDSGAAEAGQRGEADGAVGVTRMRADAGDADAAATMGSLLYWGHRGLDRDQPAARRYWGAAADAGNVGAAVAAAGMAVRGEGGPRDLPAALAYYAAAAAADDTRALNGLGYLHHAGVPPSGGDAGLPRNLTAAYELFLRAAAVVVARGPAAGGADSVLNAARCLHEGLGTPRNVSAAYALYAAAAAPPLAHFDAALTLGRMHAAGAVPAAAARVSLQAALEDALARLEAARAANRVLAVPAAVLALAGDDPEDTVAGAVAGVDAAGLDASSAEAAAAGSDAAGGAADAADDGVVVDEATEGPAAGSSAAADDAAAWNEPALTWDPEASVHYFGLAAQHGPWGRLARAGFSRYLAGDGDGAYLRWGTAWLIGARSQASVAAGNIAYLLHRRLVAWALLWGSAAGVDDPRAPQLLQPQRTAAAVGHAFAQFAAAHGVLDSQLLVAERLAGLGGGRSRHLASAHAMLLRLVQAAQSDAGLAAVGSRAAFDLGALYHAAAAKRWREMLRSGSSRDAHAPGALVQAAAAYYDVSAALSPQLPHSAPAHVAQSQLRVCAGAVAWVQRITRLTPWFQWASVAVAQLLQPEIASAC